MASNWPKINENAKWVSKILRPVLTIAEIKIRSGDKMDSSEKKVDNKKSWKKSIVWMMEGLGNIILWVNEE